jgi:hypothetical protein
MVEYGAFQGLSKSPSPCPVLLEIAARPRFRRASLQSRADQIKANGANGETNRWILHHKLQGFGNDGSNIGPAVIAENLSRRRE